MNYFCQQMTGMTPFNNFLKNHAQPSVFTHCGGKLLVCGIRKICFLEFFCVCFVFVLLTLPRTVIDFLILLAPSLYLLNLKRRARRKRGLDSARQNFVQNRRCGVGWSHDTTVLVCVGVRLPDSKPRLSVTGASSRPCVSDSVDAQVSVLSIGTHQ